MEVPIVLCFDNKHAAYAAVTTYSLRKNTARPVLVYWIVPAGHLESVAPYCERLAQTGISVSVVAADETRFRTWKERDHIPRAMYLRLLVPDLLLHQKALYLDTDTLAVSDIGPLLDTDIENNCFAGVPDPVGGQSSRVPRPMGDIYINSGVLLMNLERLRRDHFVEKIQNIYARYEQEVTWPDQCLINKYAENKKAIIGNEFNRQIFANAIKAKDWDLLVAKNETGIFHFVGSIKPWMEWCNPRVRSTWWAYANALYSTELKIMKADTVNTVLELARVLDLNEQYEEASALKSNLILTLINEIRRLIGHPKLP
jgi:lipopolysaccharide biosynthesis glycosyltransferase